MIEPVAIIAAQYPKVVIPLIDSAEESIRVIVFDWRFYPTQPGNPVSLFNQAIARAAKRGVEVRALVNSQQVVEALKDIKCVGKLLHSKKLLHTKMIIVDDVKVVLGSHNLTQNAFTFNHEASVLLEMNSTDHSFVKYFEALWGV